MPVLKVRGTKTRFRIPGVAGTGTKAQKKRQLRAIKANQRRRGTGRKS